MMKIHLFLMGALFVLVESDCDLPGNRDYVTVSIAQSQRQFSVPEGTVLSYGCQYSEQMLWGSAQRTCMRDGHWSGWEPVCLNNIAEDRPVVESHPNVFVNQRAFATDGNEFLCSPATNVRSKFVYWKIDLLANSTIHRFTLHFSGLIPNGTVMIMYGQEKEQGQVLNQTKYNESYVHSPASANSPAMNQFTSKFDLDLYEPISARFVSVGLRLEHVDSISLCEFQIFSTQGVSKQQCFTRAEETNSTLFAGIVYRDGCYARNGKLLSFNDSASECAHFGAHLANPVDLKLHSLFTNFLSTDQVVQMNSRAGVWLGGVRRRISLATGRIEFDWRWLNGSRIRDEPTTGFMEDDLTRPQPTDDQCLFMNRVGANWNWTGQSCVGGSPKFAFCQRGLKQCGLPARNARVAYQPTVDVGFAVGLFITYKCPDGYRRIGSGFDRCGPNGRWIHGSPRCESKDAFGASSRRASEAGLHTEGYIAIGLGVVVGVLILSVSILYIIYRRKIKVLAKANSLVCVGSKQPGGSQDTLDLSDDGTPRSKGVGTGRWSK